MQKLTLTIFINIPHIFDTRTSPPTRLSIEDASIDILFNAASSIN